jgi:hypothetical protein
LQVLVTGVTKLYAEMAAGNTKAKRFGRRTLVLVTELQAWINVLPVHVSPERETASIDAARKQNPVLWGRRACEGLIPGQNA